MLVDWCRNLKKKWGLSSARSKQNAHLLSRRPLKRCRPMEVEMLECRVVPTTISGTVFLDYYDNGVYTTTTSTINNDGTGTVGIAVDTPVAGVTVSAYDANNNLV